VSDDLHTDALAVRGAELVRRAALETQAPLALRERLEAQRAAARPRRRRGLVALPVGALAAALVALVLALDGGGGPGVLEVARLGPPVSGAPAVVAGRRLDAAVEGVTFPDWREDPQWQAVGRRDDELGGRDVTTVAYRTAKGADVIYAIVGGEPLEDADGARVRDVGGRRFTLQRDGARIVVTFERGGHTCVLVSDGVPAERLLEVAATEPA